MLLGQKPSFSVEEINGRRFKTKINNSRLLRQPPDYYNQIVSDDRFLSRAERESQAATYWKF